MCSEWDKTEMGEYLKKVPENHNARFCNDCGKLFHQQVECGGNDEDFPMICQPCTDKKKNVRKYITCPSCKVLIERPEGCDLIVCGCHYNGQPIFINGKQIGCGQAFCFGCSQPFVKNVLVDYECSCYIKGSYPKQYNSLKKSECLEKYLIKEKAYFLREWQMKMRDAFYDIEQRFNIYNVTSDSENMRDFFSIFDD